MFIQGSNKSILYETGFSQTRIHSATKNTRKVLLHNKTATDGFGKN